MSENNQKLVIICLFVFAAGFLRLYFGYKTWEPLQDLTSVLTITGVTGVGVHLAQRLVGSTEKVEPGFKESTGEQIE